MALQPYEWKDKPALIERLFPVQKISAESFKEQSAVQSKALTALGSYWKGRKPLILNKACILGSLLPATNDGLKDLEIFELLMGMDPESMKTRIEETLPVSKRESIGDYLVLPYHDQVRAGKRPEEIGESLFSLIWGRVNAHLGTSSRSIPELVEEMGIARFGRRPKVADVFSGSGQIPFEAARLGCDVYASDLNPMACLLTWGSFNIVGANSERRNSIRKSQLSVVKAVSEKISSLQIDIDGKGWSAKAYLYCVEVKCPESGWSVPLLPTMVVSASKFVVVKLVPDHVNKRYGIDTYYCKDKEEMESLAAGTVDSGYLVHSPDGINKYRVSIKSIRGDYKEGKENKNRLRMWEKEDFTPRADDIFQERLYCIQWMKKKSSGKQFDYEFRAVNDEDLARENTVIDYVSQNLLRWQADGHVSDMVIEAGDKTDEPIRTRGWTHWHHLYSPRQILMLALVHEEIKKQPSNSAELEIFFSRLLDWSTKLCRYGTGASRESIAQTFYNQALNTEGSPRI